MDVAVCTTAYLFFETDEAEDDDGGTDDRRTRTWASPSSFWDTRYSPAKECIFKQYAKKKYTCCILKLSGPRDAVRRVN